MQRGSVEVPEEAWCLAPEEVLERLGVNAEEGLSDEEAARRREEFGSNRLSEVRTKSAWSILLEQFTSLIMGLLGAAALVSFVFGDWVEGVAILVVIGLNAAIGFFTELQAIRSMEALRKLGSVQAVVHRGGETREIDAEEVVPGDIVVLEGGDAVNADVRLVKASKLQADESALTGESLPIAKQFQAIEADTPLAERINMAYKGTFVTRGSGLGVVVGTGMRTELGQISSLVEEASSKERTPLEKRLDELGHRLLWVTLAIAAVVAVLGILRDRDVVLMIETGVALAVAAIPEGLPVVATIALARGMMQMAKRHALIRRLSAVETLGSTTVICADKTGTLTENRMTVARIVLEDREVDLDHAGEEGGQADEGAQGTLAEALEVGVLCNTASLSEESGEGAPVGVGDPLEVALLMAAARYGLRRGELVEQYPEVRDVAFDPDVKMMATYHRSGDSLRVAVKGAAEPVLEASVRVRAGGETAELDDAARERWLQRNGKLAERGLRVIALATKTVADEEAEPYEGLTFLGLVGMHDPPRDDVRRSLDACREAGVRVVMVTGDHAVTARNIAAQVGLAEEAAGEEVILGEQLEGSERMSDEERARIASGRVLARVSPKQKLDLIAIHQRAGQVVAMTGDGVNDAPALEKADIGIAMGQRGTQVAREAADMVLEDDAFPTIVHAVERGRVIFGNIRKFVFFLLSCNASEVLVVGLASLVDAPLPVLPLQILYLNLVTDVFPALALGFGEGDPGIMRQPPRRPDERILVRRHWWAIAGYAVVITAAVLGALALARFWLGFEMRRAVTVSFLTLAAAQLWQVFNMREFGARLFDNDVVRNRFVWAALAICVGLLLFAVYVPVVSDVMKVSDPGWRGWGLVFAMSSLPWWAGAVGHFAYRRWAEAERQAVS